MEPELGNETRAHARAHVVMAVPASIERDARVRKTALAVAGAGFEVTLLWGDHRATTVAHGSLGPVQTIGLPVRYALRDTRARKVVARRRWRPVWPGFRDRDAALVSALRVEARAARTQGTSVVRRVVVAVSRQAHRARMRVFAVQERGFASLWRRIDRRRVARLPRVRWRRELANVADLEAAFTSWMVRLEPDVLHVHDVHLLGAGTYARRRLARAGKRVPLIYDAHEFVPGLSGRDPFAEAGYLQMETEFIRGVDAVITVSEPIADALAERYVLARRPVVVLNSPSAQAEAVCATDVRTAAGVDKDTTLLVYAGGLGKLRNVQAAIKALPFLTDVHLAVICVPDTVHAAATQLRRVADEHAVGGRVHLLEPVAPDETVSFMSTADIGVHPMIRGVTNHEMALPNKLFDYVFAGLPVVVSDVSEMDRFVHRWGVGETFDPSDPAALATAVRTVMADLDGYRTRASSAELRATYSWERQAEGISGLYEELTRA